LSSCVYPIRLLSSLVLSLHDVLFFFFNATAPTEIYTLSLHDALPIYVRARLRIFDFEGSLAASGRAAWEALEPEIRAVSEAYWRSEEHTSELQSRRDLVCRLLLEKKKKAL